MTYSYGPQSAGASLITRKDIRQPVLEEIGGYVSTIASGSTTTYVINEFLNRFADDNALKNYRSYAPQEAAPDRERYFTAWDDSAAQATVATITSPTADNDIEIYAPDDPTHHEINRAINRFLQENRRPVMTAIPIRSGARRYGQVELPWVRDSSDILSVDLRSSPNLLNNEDFEYWGTGDSPALQSWVLVGSGSTVARTQTVQAMQPYAATITGAADPTTLTQTIRLLDRQLIGETIRAEVLCLASAGSVARLQVTDGVTTANSSYHTGGGTYERLSITEFEIDAAATTLTFTLRHEAATGSSSWSRAIATTIAIPAWLQNYGSESARTTDVRYRPTGTGEGAAVELIDELGRGSQLWVQSLQPYAELTNDTDVTDAPLEAAMASTLTRIARRRRSQNQARWDEVLAIWQPKALRWQQRLSQPAEPSQTTVVVGPA